MMKDIIRNVMKDLKIRTSLQPSFFKHQNNSKIGMESGI